VGDFAKGGLGLPVRGTCQSLEPVGSRHPVRMGRLELFNMLTLCISNRTRQLLSTIFPKLRRVCGKSGMT